MQNKIIHLERVDHLEALEAFNVDTIQSDSSGSIDRAEAAAGSMGSDFFKLSATANTYHSPDSKM